MIDWTKSQLVPRANMQAWHYLAPNYLANGNPVDNVPDWSLMGRTIAATSNYPQLSKGALNGYDGVYFDGTKNPLKYTGTVLTRHIFIVASIFTSTFSGNNGLLSGAANFPLLVGNGSGSTKFVNNGYAATGYTYRKDGFVTGEANQIAPVNNQPAVIEMQFVGDAAGLDGIQVGQDRGNTSRKLNGTFFEDMYFSEIQSDFDRRRIYQYFAQKYHLWQDNGAGIKVFPFAANAARSLSQSRTFYQSKPYSGPSTTLLRGGVTQSVSVSCAARKQPEYLAAEAFHAEHYARKEFVFRDYKFCPARDSVMTFTSELTQGGEGVFFDYGFTASEGAISSYTFLETDADEYLIT